MGKQPEIVTRQELADLWGVSPSAIDNLVQTGKLPKAGHGKFDLKVANRARAALRPTANRTDRIIRIAKAEEARAAKKAKKANVPIEPAAPPDLTVIEGGKKDGGASGMASTLAKARTTREVFSAKAAELNYRKEAGLVVETEKVKQSAANASRLIVARLRAFPSRLGPQLAPLTDAAECVKTIESEIKSLIEEFHEMMAGL